MARGRAAMMLYGPTSEGGLADYRHNAVDRAWLSARCIMMRQFMLLAAILVIAPTAALAQPPKVTELLKRRSTCAQLGQRLADQLGQRLADEYPATASRSGQLEVYRYDPVTGHCYVEIDTHGASGEFSRSLFDGQTGEVLADTRSKNGEKIVGAVFDPQHKHVDPKAANSYGYDDANAYIDKIMAEDREGRQ
jgi:hypothetical protein